MWAATLVAVLLLGAQAQGADDFNYQLTLGTTSGMAGETATVSSMLDDPNGVALAGWSFGVCQTGPAQVIDVQPGVTTLTVNDGAPPDVEIVNLGVDGWTAQVVIDLRGQASLPPDNGHELHLATYELQSPGLVLLNYCDTLGNPPVAVELTDTSGLPISPFRSPGGIQILPSDPELEFSLADVVGSYDPETGVGDVIASPRIAEIDTGAGFPHGTDGFSMVLSHDTSVLVATAVEPALALQTLQNGDGPDFFDADLLASGISCNVIYDFSAQETLAFPAATAVLDVTYATNPDTLAGNTFGVVTDLIWADVAPGNPPIVNQVLVDGMGAVFPALLDGQIELLPLSSITFLRGDCNADGRVSLADGVGIFIILFRGDGEPLPCPEACNANGDDALISIADALYLLLYSFAGGPPPPAPFPECGSDEDATCDEFLACPAG